MGAYLSKPETAKQNEEDSIDGFRFAATTMQGWRANQEDAHNSILNFAEGYHLFAVYDGHGGSEVSKYTAAHFPEFLKDKKFWESEDFEKTMRGVFIDFDDKLRSEATLKELAVLANDKKEDEEEVSDDEADRIGTIEESTLPIEQLLAKYGYKKGGGGNSQKSIISALFSQSLKKHNIADGDVEDEDDADYVEKVNTKKRNTRSPLNTEAKKLKIDEEDKVKDTEVAPAVEEIEEGEGGSLTKEQKKERRRLLKQEQKENAQGEYSDSDEDFDEEDVEPEEEMEDDVEDEEIVDEEDEEEDARLGLTGEVPGEDSGTTACVCLISKEKVIVANAGDSRAVLSRGYKAVDLSVDHKPEDDVEMERIDKAGGQIIDGRVNGGLNLSRALGDHTYKKNASLPLAEQMITALPDVKIEKLNGDEDFLIVACDGIWNSMESQEVVDFIASRIENGKTPLEITNELCDHCLADSTDGDGTGCDNMTAILTVFDKKVLFPK